MSDNGDGADAGAGGGGALPEYIKLKVVGQVKLL